MQNSQTPPPWPPALSKPQKSAMTSGTKILLLGLQCGLLMIGALIVWAMTYSRDQQSHDVCEEISQEWGTRLFIDGPEVYKSLDSNISDKPKSFVCNATVNTQSLHRSIYEVEVYDAKVAISGIFCKSDMSTSGDTVFIKMLVHTDQLVKASPLIIGGKEYEWTKDENFIYAKIDMSDMPDDVKFSTSLDVRGSQSLGINPIGRKSDITIDGNAANPSFYGLCLPTRRSVQDDKFSAQWQIEGVYSNVEDPSWSEYVSVEFLVGVDRYQKVSRTLKYSFLIILFTYISVFVVEIVKKRNIPLINYFLIGAALVLFYSLLLSFVEQMSFGLSYLIASAMTILLITAYMWRMIGSKSVAFTICAILAVMYVSCFILLSLSTYALLLGSLMLFVALAVMMYCSLKIKQ